jgi:hypothetical protein
MLKDPEKDIAFIMKDARGHINTLYLRRLYERIP